MKFFQKSAFVFVAVCFSLCAAGCRRGGAVSSINESVLFSLNYGNFEDELNLFNLSTAGAVQTHMTMEDGFFYIANGESKKILELNSYGDILTLFYNDEVTKPSSFAGETGDTATKKAVAYPFNTLGSVAVDSRKCLYVVDTLPPERQELDLENRLLLNNIVLRFNSDGTFMDYIGQQGAGGTPFPFIKKIYATKNDELVVVCETNSGPTVFWFNQKGFLLYKIPFSVDSVPKLKEDDDEVLNFISIQNVVPDNVEKKLYVHVEYFYNYLDPDTKIQSGIEFDRTLLYPLDVETGRYGDALEIPSHEDVVSETLGKSVYNIPFDFLGVTDTGWFFFMLPIEKGFLVQMVQPNGQKVLKRVLPVDHGEILYYSLSLSGGGIISGLFVRRSQADVMWWRTDYLVSSFAG